MANKRKYKEELEREIVKEKVRKAKTIIVKKSRDKEPNSKKKKI